MEDGKWREFTDGMEMDETWLHIKIDCSQVDSTMASMNDEYHSDRVRHRIAVMAKFHSDAPHRQLLLYASLMAGYKSILLIKKL